MSHAVLTVVTNTVRTLRLGWDCSRVDRAEFASSPPPPGVFPAQHACQGKAFTQGVQFAKFSVEPWAVTAAKEGDEGDKRIKGRSYRRSSIKRPIFAWNLSRRFPGRWGEFLDTTPCLSPFILSRTLCSRISQPTCLDSCHAERTWGSKFVPPGSVEVPHWDPHGWFSITSKPSSLDLWSCLHYSQHVQVGVCYLPASLAVWSLKTTH